MYLTEFYFSMHLWMSLLSIFRIIMFNLLLTFIQMGCRCPFESKYSLWMYAFISSFTWLNNYTVLDDEQVDFVKNCSKFYTCLVRYFFWLSIHSLFMYYTILYIILILTIMHHLLYAHDKTKNLTQLKYLQHTNHSLSA